MSPHPQFYKGEQMLFTRDGAVSLQATYVPNVPNTGFSPLDVTSLVFALVLLGALGIALYPYVRKAFAIVRS